MSAIFSVFISLLIGGMILLIGINMTQEVTRIVLSDNEQISIARAYELGEMMDKLKWQLKIMSSRNVLSEGDPAVVEATMKDQKKYLSPEVVGAFYAWNSGDYVTSDGAKGNVSDRDYFKEIFVSGMQEAVGKAVISKSLNVPIIVTTVAIPAQDGKNKAFVALQFKLEELSNIVTLT
jgi:Ni/Co efflux regulator RcnB